MTPGGKNVKIRKYFLSDSPRIDRGFADRLFRVLAGRNNDPRGEGEWRF